MTRLRKQWCLCESAGDGREKNNNGYKRVKLVVATRATEMTGQKQDQQPKGETQWEQWLEREW